MVQLLQFDRIQPPVYEIFGVRRVTYSITEEIPSLLSALPPQYLSSSQMAPSDLSSGNSLVGMSVEENAEDDHVDALNEVIEVLSDHEEEDPNFIPQTDLPEVIYAHYSDDEKKAVIFIQKTYRKVLEQRRLRNKTGMEGLIRHYFHLCWEKVREENRERDEYTQAFLGPLPHLLSILDSAESLTMAKKREMKKGLVRGGAHESLDEISLTLNRIPYALDFVS